MRATNEHEKRPPALEAPGAFLLRLWGQGAVVVPVPIATGVA